MTISIKPTASGSTIEQDGSTILTVDGSGNLTFPNNATFSGSVTGISSYSDSDALTLFNVSGSAPVYAARAWVNFNGSGTVAIRSSGNVSSITDNGTGDFTLNFTTAMPDANYNCVGSVSGLTSDGYPLVFEVIRHFNTTTAPTSSAIRIFVLVSGVNDVYRDSQYINVTIIR